MHLRSADKLQVYEQICEKYQLRDEEVLYMGDDIPDLPVLKRVGVSTCPQDAVPEVKAVSHYQSPLMGGKACVREVIEQVLKVQDTWMTEEAYHW